jgi:hypothetical protein
VFCLWMWIRIPTHLCQQHWFSHFYTFQSTHIHFVVVNNSVHTRQPINRIFLPISLLQTAKKRTTVHSSSLVQTSSTAAISMPHSFGTKELQLNHTYNMEPSDLQLQHDQTTAVFPIVQQKHSNTAKMF